MLSVQQVIRFQKADGRIHIQDLDPNRHVICLKETEDQAVWYFKRRHCFYTHRDVVVLPAFYALVNILREPSLDSPGTAVVLECKETNRFSAAIRRSLYAKMNAT